MIGNAATGAGIQINTTNVYHSADGSTQATKATTLLDGAAHHVVIVRNGTVSVDFWVDGVFLGSNSIDTNADWTPASLFYRPSSGTLYYEGKIRAFRIYQRELTNVEIVRQYNSGYGNWPLDTAAFLIYEFDGTGGTGTSTETDQSGNGKTLTLQNTPTRGAW
jgi:hypothetical protein